MNNKTVFVKTAKGEAEASGQTSLLFGEAKRVFMLVNDRSTVDDMRKHAAPSLRPELEGILEQLARDEFIRDRDDKGPKKKPVSGFTPKIATPRMAVPPKPAPQAGAAGEEDALDFTSGQHPPVRDTGEPPAAEPAAPAGGGKSTLEDFDFAGLVAETGGEAPKAPEPPAEPAAPAAGPDEIDFSSLFSSTPAPDAGKPASPPKPATGAEKAPSNEVDFSSIFAGGGQAVPNQAGEDAQAKARAEAEAKARAVAEAKMRAEAEARARAAAQAKTRAEAEARARAEERARQEAAARARTEAEAKARIRAQMEAKMRADAAAKAKAEAEAKARMRAQMEAKMRADAAAKARAEAEARAKAEAQRARSAPASLSDIDLSGLMAPSGLEGGPDQARPDAAQTRAEAQAKQARSAPASLSDIDLSGLMEPSALDGEPDQARPGVGEARAKAEARARADLEADKRNLQGRRARADAQARASAEPEADMGDVDVPDQRSADGIPGRVAAQLSGGVASLLKGLSSKLRGAKEGPTAEAASPARVAAQLSGGAVSLLKGLSSRLRGGKEAPTVEDAPAAEEAPPARQPADSGEWAAMDIPGAPDAPRRQARATGEVDARAEQEAEHALAEQEAAEAREEEASRKLAAEQAKAFAEAEKRARKAAKAEEKARRREAREEAKARAMEEKKRAQLGAAAAERKARQDAARRKVRRPVRRGGGGHGFPLFKALFLLIVLAVGAVVGLPYFWPMQKYVPLVEQELSSQLKQPVRIAAMHVATVPEPRLDLLGVTVGKRQQLKIGRVVLYFDPVSLLLSHVKKISKLEVDQVAVDADTLAAATPWLLAAGSSPKYPVKMLQMKHARVRGEVPLPPFGGKIMFNEYGKVAEASLATSNGSYRVVFQPKDRNHTHVEASITDAPLPLMSAVQFDDLEMAGDMNMSGRTIDFTNLSGNLYGGSISGVASLSWQSGWHAQGNVSFQSVVLKQALPDLKISGALEGAAAFVLNGATLGRLTRVPHLAGTFRVKDGQIGGIDVAQTLRSDTGRASAGDTHFDTMNGSMRLDAGGGHFRPITIGAGALDINGSADAAFDGGLSGRFLVDTSRVRAGLGTLPLRLSGTLSAPVWSIARYR